MSDLTLEEKFNSDVERARQLTAEKHFFDLAQPHYPLGFLIIYLNPGHWDVIAAICPGRASAWRAAHPTGSTWESDYGRERAFRIRGGPGEVLVYDERWDPHRINRQPAKFRSVLMAVMWIAEELMQEPSKK